MTAPEAGSVGEEARRLVQALATWAEARTAPTDTDKGTDRGTNTGDRPRHAYLGDWAAAPASDPPPASCGFCPLCQVIALARGQRPEVIAKLVEAATAALGALTLLAEQREAPERPAPAGPPEQPDATPVQRIDIG